MAILTHEGSGCCGFSPTDAKKVVIGALVAAAGAALTYLSGWMSGADFGVWTPTITAAWAVFANAVRKYLTDTNVSVARP